MTLSFAGQDSFKAKAAVQQKLNRIAEKAKQLLKQLYSRKSSSGNNLEGEDRTALLTQCIESQGTPVCVVKGFTWPIQLLMGFFGFEFGFIPPQPNKKEYNWLLRCLEWFQPNVANASAKGVFVLTEPLHRMGFMTHQFHHWLAYREGLPGYEPVAQSLYKTFWGKYGGQVENQLHTLSYEEAVALKQAINRDLEALTFIREITNEIFVPEQQGALLSTGKTVA